MSLFICVVAIPSSGETGDGNEMGYFGFRFLAGRTGGEIHRKLQKRLHSLTEKLMKDKAVMEAAGNASGLSHTLSSLNSRSRAPSSISMSVSRETSVDPETASENAHLKLEMARLFAHMSSWLDIVDFNTVESHGSAGMSLRLHSILNDDLLDPSGVYVWSDLSRFETVLDRVHMSYIEFANFMSEDMSHRRYSTISSRRSVADNSLLEPKPLPRVDKGCALKVDDIIKEASSMTSVQLKSLQQELLAAARSFADL